MLRAFRRGLLYCFGFFCLLEIAAAGPETLSELHADLLNQQSKFPPIEIISSDRPSFASSIKRIFLSEPSKASGHPEILSGVDIPQTMAEFAQDIAHATNKTGVFSESFLKTPAERKFLVIGIYHESNGGGMQAIDAAAQNNFGISLLITNGADYFDVLKFNGAKSSSHFARDNIQFKEGRLGDNLKELLAKGRVSLMYPNAPNSTPHHLVVSPPVYDPNLVEMDPLFHKKIIIGGVLDKDVKDLKSIDEILAAIREIYTLAGDANMSKPGDLRVGSAFIIDDFHLGKAELEHLLLESQTFTAGGRISDVPEKSWKKIVYKDGSSVLATHSNGYRNTNVLTALDYTTAALSTEASKFPYVEIKSSIFGEFTSTFTKGNEALEYSVEAGLKNKRKFPSVFLADEQFAESSGYGGLGRFVGYFIDRGTLIPGLFPFSEDVQNAVTTRTYIRAIPGRPVTSIQGVPQNFIMHLKINSRSLLVSDEAENLRSVDRTACLSCNWSSHFSASAGVEIPGNSETQWHIEEPTEVAVVGPILRTYVNEIANSKYAVDGAAGPFVLWISQFLQMAPEEVSLAKAQEIFELIQKQNFDKAFAEIVAMSQKKSTITEQIPSEIVEKKAKIMVEGINRLQQAGYKFSPQQVVALANLGTEGHHSQNLRSRAQMSFALGGLAAEKTPLEPAVIDRGFASFQWASILPEHRVNAFTKIVPVDGTCKSVARLLAQK
ncbi:MAG: hypothetical protein J0L93_03075 [Deltaproteobacteria bacterium]|nr:hypothetical protein [Deltaproteobacteria bacterium]